MRIERRSTFRRHQTDFMHLQVFFSFIGKDLKKFFSFVCYDMREDARGVKAKECLGFSHKIKFSSISTTIIVLFSWNK